MVLDHLQLERMYNPHEIMIMLHKWLIETGFRGSFIFDEDAFIFSSFISRSYTLGLKVGMALVFLFSSFCYVFLDRSSYSLIFSYSSFIFLSFISYFFFSYLCLYSSASSWILSYLIFSISKGLSTLPISASAPRAGMRQFSNWFGSNSI